MGMHILDLSKTLMYDFYYDYIRQNSNSKAKSLFTDTDSLRYEIETGDAYADFWKDKKLSDNIDYSKDSQFFDSTNKKVISWYAYCGICWDQE